MNYISETAIIGKNVTLGKFSVIEDDVRIGSNCVIGHGVIVRHGSIIGDNVRIDENSVIGKEPMRSVISALDNDDRLPPCVVDCGVIVGACAVVYRGCRIEADVMIADLATVRENVRVGAKTIVGRNVAIENNCRIGSFCKIETNAYITAFSVLEDYVFIAPGVVTSNDNYAGRTKARFSNFRGVTVKRGGRIGAQATILPGRIISEDAFVAAGALVSKDVDKEIIVMGSPAKFYKRVDTEQLLENQSQPKDV